MRTGKKKRSESNASATDARFVPVVKAFAGKPHVMREQGKGFGSGALKVNGKIFAMVSSRGQLVVKLPRERVDELVQAGLGKRFDLGNGRIMKEWLAVHDETADWVALAREAHEFIKRR